MDGDEDLRAEFSCPYCYEEFDITALCSHLEEEHCFESRAAVGLLSNLMLSIFIARISHNFVVSNDIYVVWHCSRQVLPALDLKCCFSQGEYFANVRFYEDHSVVSSYGMFMLLP